MGFGIRLSIGGAGSEMGLRFHLEVPFAGWRLPIRTASGRVPQFHTTWPGDPFGPADLMA
jgi:hypothetical protein